MCNSYTLPRLVQVGETALATGPEGPRAAAVLPRPPVGGYVYRPRVTRTIRAATFPGSNHGPYMTAPKLKSFNDHIRGIANHVLRGICGPWSASLPGTATVAVSADAEIGAVVEFLVP